MKIKALLFLISFLTFSCQTKQNKDQAEDKITEIISWIEKKDMDALLQNTTDTVFCTIGFDLPNKSRTVSKQEFYEQHVNRIFSQELLKRIKRNKKTIISEKSENRDIIVFYTTHDKNELGKGHEGGQFGFWLKEEKGIWKLSGVETIP